MLLELEAELGRNHYLPSERGKSFADELLICERPVHLRRIKKGDGSLRCPANYRDHRLFISAGSVVSHVAFDREYLVAPGSQAFGRRADGVLVTIGQYDRSAAFSEGLGRREPQS